MFRRPQPPAWVLPGAGLDMDFKNFRCWGGFINYGSTNTGTLRNGSLMSQLNSVALTAPDIDGTIINFPVACHRITRGLGLWVEGGNTNYLLRSRELENASWTKTNMTVTRNQIGADNAANSACLLTATAANGTCLQSITRVSTQYVGSAHVRRSVGTGTVEMTMDNGTTWVDITSQINSSRFTWVEMPQQTVTNPVFGFRLGTNGDAIVVDFTQLENVLNGVAAATTPIVTTTASVGRGTNYPQFGTTATGFNDGQRIIDTYQYGRPVSAYIEASGNGTASGVVKGGGSGAYLRLTNFCSGGTANFASNSSTGSVSAVTANTGTYGRGNINKCVIRINGTKNSVCLNGGAIADGNYKVSFDPLGSDNHMAFGNRGANDQPLNGYICRFAFFPYELTDGQMIEMSKL